MAEASGDCTLMINKRTKIEILKTLLLLIPPGKVVSYKDLSIILNTSPRTIGKWLSKNNEIIVFPCHRVVKTDGSLGGYSAGGGIEMKRKLLELEGIVIKQNKIPKEYFINLSSFLLPQIQKLNDSDG